jgi:hypothetical protein
MREFQPSVASRASRSNIRNRRGAATIADAQGFVGASSVECIPIERAVKDLVSAFKGQRLRGGLNGVANGAVQVAAS